MNACLRRMFFFSRPRKQRAFAEDPQNDPPFSHKNVGQRAIRRVIIDSNRHIYRKIQK